MGAGGRYSFVPRSRLSYILKWREPIYSIYFCNCGGTYPLPAGPQSHYTPNRKRMYMRYSFGTAELPNRFYRTLHRGIPQIWKNLHFVLLSICDRFNQVPNRYTPDMGKYIYSVLCRCRYSLTPRSRLSYLLKYRKIVNLYIFLIIQYFALSS